MTKYKLIILFLFASSIVTVLLGMLSSDKKGLTFQLYKLFAGLMLLTVLLLGYRAFFLIR